MEQIGVVKHYFGKIGVAAINITGTLKVGDKIKIKGAKTDFEQTVESMQIDKNPIQEAKPGDDVGMKISEKVREKDIVYKL